MLTNLRKKVLPLWAQSQAFMPSLGLPSLALHSQTLPILTTLKTRYSFSSYFSEMDKSDIKEYSERKFQNKKYRDMIALWKQPLEQKRRRHERIKQIK